MTDCIDTGKANEERVSKTLEQVLSPEPENRERRLVIRKLAVGTVALAGCSVLPAKWTMPLVEFGALPAHATTSGAIVSIIEALKDEIEPAAKEDQGGATAGKATDSGAADMRGYDNKLTISNKGERMSYNSIWQDKIVFPKLGPDYGKSLLIVWSDGKELSVPDSSHMVMLAPPDARKFQPGGKYSHNNPKIPTMEVYAARGTHPKSVTLYY